MKVAQYQMIVRKDTGRSHLRKIRDVITPESCRTVMTPDAVCRFAKNVLELDTLAEEEFYILAINSKSKVIGVFMVSHGTVNATVVSPREIFQRALLVGATNIIAIHNHPSQDSRPSNDDISTTKRLKEVGALIGVQLVDHVIIGDEYYSFKEKGLL